MNIDELRQTLQTMALETDPVDDRDRLHEVERRVTRARRRRAGAVIGCAVAVAALTVAVPSLVGTGDGQDSSTDSVTRPTSTLPTVEDRGTRFYTSPAGDTLLGEAMGRTGSPSLTLRVVPPTDDLSYRSVCWRPTASRSPRLLYDLVVNGHRVKSASCDGRPYGPLGPDSTFGPGSPRANISAWRGLGVFPGHEMTLRLSLRPGVSARVAASTQLGVAVYANTGARGHDHGVWYPQQVVVDGDTYGLARRGLRAVSGLRGHLSMDLPVTAQPLYLVYGVEGAHSGYDLTGDSSGAHSETSGASSYAGMGKRGQRTAHADVRLQGRPGATLYILAYRRVG
jgi:hypothetical protein